MDAKFTAAPQSVNSNADWSTSVLSPMTEKEEQNGNFTSQSRIEFYSSNADTYDEDMKKYSFSGPDVAAHTLHNLLKDNPNSRILDVGCGTGKVAEVLLALGPYTNIDGLEAAPGMLALARAKQLYKNTMEKFLYLNCGLEHDTYDGVVSSGTFVAGHMKSDCLIELCNILKPGGHLVITMRHEHLETVSEYKENFRLTIDNLVKEGKWKIIQDETFPNWCFGDNGMGIDGHVFVFQKNLMS